jgi:hypothetical protein
MLRKILGRNFLFSASAFLAACSAVPSNGSSDDGFGGEFAGSGGANSGVGGAPANGGAASSGGTGGSKNTGSSGATACAGDVVDAGAPIDTTFSTSANTVPQRLPDLLGPLQNDPVVTTVGGSPKNAEETIEALRTDAAGNIYVLSVTSAEYRITRYDSSFNQTWQSHQANASNSVRLQALTIAADGNIAVAGEVTGSLPGEASVGGVDIAVGMYSATTGELLWMHQVGGTTDDYATSIAATSDGGIVVVGQSSNEGALIKFNLDGKLAWQKLAIDHPSDVTVDSSGNEYVVNASSAPSGNSVAKYDPNGAVVWTSKNPGAGTVSAIALGPNGNAPFLRGSVLAAVNAEGGYVWYRNFGGERAAVCGQNWTGSFPLSAGISTDQVARISGPILVTNDAVYLSGVYQNDYAAASNAAAKPNSTSAYVARYDSKGNSVWFHEFSVTNAGSGEVGNFGPDTGFMAPLPNGALVVIVRAVTGQGFGGWSFVKINMADGRALSATAPT